MLTKWVACTYATTRAREIIMYTLQPIKIHFLCTIQDSCSNQVCYYDRSRHRLRYVECQEWPDMSQSQSAWAIASMESNQRRWPLTTLLCRIERQWKQLGAMTVRQDTWRHCLVYLRSLYRLFTNYGRPLSVSGRPCYILPMFIYLFIFYDSLILRPWLTEVRKSFTRGGPWVSSEKLLLDFFLGHP